MKIEPLHDRVLVKRDEADSKTEGGLFIPESAEKEKPSRGEVIAAGTGLILEDGRVRPMSVRAGDKILFGRYSGHDVELGKETLLILREEDILGRISE